MSENKPEVKEEGEKKGYDTNEKYKNFKWQNEEDFKNGPMSDEKRSCRDILCFLIFLCFLGGCVAIAVMGFTGGNPNLIIYPYDEDAKQCGFKEYLDYPFLYFYSPLDDLKNYITESKIHSFCLKTCPKNDIDEKQQKDNPTNHVTVDCKATKGNANCQIEYKNYYNSTGLINRFCVPKSQDKPEPETMILNGVIWVKQTDVEESANTLFNKAFFSVDKLVTWVADLFVTWPVLLAALGWSFLLAMIFLFVVRFCAGFMIYTSILLILGAIIALGVFCHLRADIYTSVDDSIYYTTMVALAYTCYVLAFIFLVFILFMCNRIRLAVGLMEATAKYIHSNCCIVFIPFFFFLFTGAFYTYWVFLSVYIYSTGEVDSESTILATINWSNKTRYSWWFHLFALLYINEMINAVTQFIYASSACIWYFTHEKGGAERPICKSFKRVFRYHFGSLAFGALIIAIIRFIMIMMNYIKKKVDKTLGNNSKVGKIYKCIICCCQCCMNCVARTMEFINKHAFIQIALKGDNFCVAAWEGFGIVVRNLGRFSTLFLIGGFFNIFGTIFISAASGLTGYLLITKLEYFSADLNSPVLPTFVMTLTGFIIGLICMSVFGTSADALMHSFLLDEEINKGQPKSYPELQKFMTDER